MPIRGSELNPPVQLEILSFIKSSDFLPTASDLQFLTGGEAVGSTNGHFASRRKKKMMKKPQINSQKTFSDGISLLRSHDATYGLLSFVGVSVANLPYGLDINEYKYL